MQPVRLLALALALLTFLPSVAAFDALVEPALPAADDHDGLPGLGSLDGWVDVDGDTMFGTLTMGDQTIQFANGALVGGSGAPGLRFAGRQVCTADSVINGCGGGDITSVLAGFGLAGGGLAGDVSLAVDASVIQQRVGGVCAAGSSIRSVAQDGTATCEPDDDTTYSAGAGLVLSGTQFSVNQSSLQARVTGTCLAGNYVRAINADGSVTCGSDANSGGTVTSVATGPGLQGGTITGSGTVDLRLNGTGGLTKTLGAGANELGIPASGIVPAMLAPGTYGIGITGTATTATALGANPANCAAGQFAAGIAASGAAEGCATAVTSVASGAGLTGGPITGAGTLSLKDCTSGEVLKSGGPAVWNCAADAGGASYAAGDGLTLSGTTFTVQDCAANQVLKRNAGDTSWACAPDADTTYSAASPLALTGTNFGFSTVGCVNGEVWKFNGTAWNCVADADTTYAAGAGLALAGTTFRVQDCASGEVLKSSGAGTWGCAADLGGSGWDLGGNGGTTPGTNFLGTTDNKALEFKVNGARVLRLEPSATSPNVLAGFSGNNLTSGVLGAVIAGGGEAGKINRVTDWYGTVGGGFNNTAGDGVSGTTSVRAPTVAGGEGNKASGFDATVGGGENNEAPGGGATVAGGDTNIASGAWSGVGGGYSNLASGQESTAAGGNNNEASGIGAAVGGGKDNTANTTYAAITGGYGNRASGSYSALGGGYTNTASGSSATVAGGNGNTASGTWSSVGGGNANIASNDYTTVAGGQSNAASSMHAAVGGGYDNTANARAATVAGGDSNTASGSYATVGGGIVNIASGFEATVGGGAFNDATGDQATVAGGYSNTITFVDYATVGGGYSNWNNGNYATIGGGNDNTATNTEATVGGGHNNTASGADTTVGGGDSNVASGGQATVAGGVGNVASSTQATVSGGYHNTASDVSAAVGGGDSNLADGAAAVVGGGYINTANASRATVGGGYSNVASGSYSTVPGGYDNVAGGSYSLAAGRRAHADHQGAFVWADSQNLDFTSGANDQFLIRAQGGVGINSNSISTEIDLDVAGQIEMGLNTSADTTIGLCKNVADGDSTNIRFRECNGTPGDVAEWYAAPGAQPGDIVVATADLLSYQGDLMDPRSGLPLGAKETHLLTVLQPAAQAYAPRILGIISTNPAVTYGKGVLEATDDAQPLAIAGRVPVRVTAANGAIHAGDPITSSMLAGVGMLATEPGPIVGYALAPFEGPGVGSILVYVAPGWHGGAAQAALAAENAALKARLDRIESALGLGGAAASAPEPASAPAAAAPGGAAAAALAPEVPHHRGLLEGFAAWFSGLFG